jgi:hypothetical protein
MGWWVARGAVVGACRQTSFSAVEAGTHSSGMPKTLWLLEYGILKVMLGDTCAFEIISRAGLE